MRSHMEWHSQSSFVSQQTFSKLYPDSQTKFQVHHKQPRLLETINYNFESISNRMSRPTTDKHSKSVKICVRTHLFFVFVGWDGCLVRSSVWTTSKTFPTCVRVRAVRSNKFSVRVHQSLRFHRLSLHIQRKHSWIVRSNNNNTTRTRCALRALFT